ncbi:MAG: ABC transporter permease [Micromonosporaceae bacterium]
MKSLAGTNALLGLALRRDRIMLPVWVYAFTAAAYASAASTKKLYPTVRSRVEFAAGAGSNPTTIAIYGPSDDLHTLGGLATWKMSALGAVLVGVMSMVIVTRHTRADEEAGRLELVSAGVVGRRAALTVALLVALAANLLIALLVGAGLVAGGAPAGASFAFGLALAAAGCMFAAVAALAAQLAQSARAANGIVIVVLAVAYLLRGAGDAASTTSWMSGLSWASPIGWTQHIRPFGPIHWWVFGVAAAFAAVFTCVAYAIVAERDIGAGLLPPRPGPPRAGASLRGALGLAWRLERGPLLAWAAGFALYGAVIGGIADGVGALVNDSPAATKLFAEMGGQFGLVDAFIAATMGFMGVLAAVYTTAAVLRLRAEETGQRAEPVLAAAVGRTRWAFSHLAFAVAGPVILLGAAGLMAGFAHGARTGDMATQLPRVLGAAFVQLPAAWMLTGVAMALFGLAPRLAAVSWGAVAASLMLGEFGPVFGLKQWAMDLSPFTHLPKLPGAAFAVPPLAWLTVAAALLVAAGLAGLRLRDIG